MKDLRALSEKEVPNATAAALNRLAKGASLQVRDRMEEVFDRPTPFTLKGFYAKPARANDLEAWVATRDYAPKGSPAIRYLGPQIRGGRRDMKGIERALSPLSGGQFILPGKDAPLDQYGNISRGVLVQIMSRLSVMRDSTANISSKTAARLAKAGKNVKGQKSEYFIGRERGNGRPTGVYKLVGPGKVAQILKFVAKPPTYKAVLPVEQIVQDTIARRAGRIAQEEIIKAFQKRGLR
ncbi:hypothetical protein [Acetobacter nitrogenifigens]|nr:hypothetical protein [Acetobacter nitrogenifigens]